MSNARVLVVDDERFFREAIEEILVGRGFQCELCEDGESALERVLDDEIGVAVLDIRLPGVDGIEVLRRFRESRPDVRVIMLSASTDQELVLDALREGACDYLAKPLHDEELVLAVSRSVESFELSREASGLRERMQELASCITDLTVHGSESDEGLDLGGLFEQAAEAASRILDAGKTSLMMLDDEGGQLEVAALVGRDLAPDQMDTVAPGRGVAGVAFEDVEPILVADMSREERFVVDPAPGRYESDSFVVVPIHLADEKLGVICAADRREEGGFTLEDLALLQILAAQVAVLVRAMRLHRAAAVERALTAEGMEQAGDPRREDEALPDVESQESNCDTEIARQVCDAMASQVEPGRVLRDALRPLEKLLHAEPAALYLVDGVTGDLVLEAAGEGALREERSRLPAGGGLTGSVLQNGHLVAAVDPAADSRFDPKIDTPLDGKPGPFMCVPLQLRGKTVGLCRLHLPEGAPVMPGTAEMLVSVLSAAVRNVLLYRSLLESIDEVATARREARR
jgi:FixJ family two-component response regulator/putative methionine-R-sulfoxide reductase with GAF domain